MSRVRLWIVRHGETEANKLGIVQGHSDWPLSEVGFGQARLAADRLKNIEFGLAYSSDLKRASQTCDAILNSQQSQNKCERIQETLLRERCFGVWEDHSYADIKAQGRALGYEPPNEWAAPFEGGETDDQVRWRCQEFYEKLNTKLIELINSGVENAPIRESPAIDASSAGKPLDGASKPYSHDNDISTNQNSIFDASPADDFNVLIASHGGWIRRFTELLARTCGDSLGHPKLRAMSQVELNHLPVPNCSITCFQMVYNKSTESIHDNHTGNSLSLENHLSQFLLLNYNDHILKS